MPLENDLILAFVKLEEETTATQRPSAATWLPGYIAQPKPGLSLEIEVFLGSIELACN